MGRNTIASGYHATAFGLSTQAKAWYATAMGQGTVAESRTETVLGSYNTTYTPAGGTREWNPSDRLFVLGNGTGSSIASRTDALIIYKDGSSTTHGICSGPGFNIVADPTAKATRKRIKKQTEKLLKLKVVQIENRSRPGNIRFGFIAQELEQIYPELVHSLNGTQEIKSIDYLGLIPIFVDLVQQQQQQQQELDALKEKINH